MIKILSLCLMLLVGFVPSTLADFDFIVADATEYEYGVMRLNNESLLVTGSGVHRIEAWDFSLIEIRGTSPLSNSGGITDINLGDNSHLIVLEGEIAGVDFGGDSTAELRGGSINYIRSFQYSGIKHIDLYCQPGWSWIKEDGDTTGITGLWVDNTVFDIDFVDYDGEKYPPVWTNINVIEVPEPATLVLLGFGGFLIRRKK